MKIIDGKLIAEKIRFNLRDQVIKIIKDKKGLPGLAVILIGNDKASKIYVNMKKMACQQVGIAFHDYLFPENADPSQIKMTIDYLNQDPDIHGIFVQLPVPKGLDADQIINFIKREKDVDGLRKDSKQTSPLILAIFESLKATAEDFKNKKILAIAKNKTFLSHLRDFFKRNDLKVDLISPDDISLKEKTKKADVIISVVGKPNMIKKDTIKDDATLIDCGFNQTDSKVTGDVDINDVMKKAGWVTPVPGGIGPVTVAMLLKNTLKLYNENS